MNNFLINNIAVNDYGGDRAVLIFIHAFPLNSGMWEKQVEYFKDKYRVITFDIRGFGKSINTDFFNTIDRYTEDLFQIINTLNLKEVNICGLSMGGYILLRALSINQDAINTAIICDSKSERDSNTSLLSRFESVKNILNGHRKEFENDIIKKLLCKDSLSNNKIPDFISSIISQNTDESICSSLLAMASRIDTTEFLSKISIPVLFNVGEYDALTPKELSIEMAEKCRNSEVEIIANAGHLPNIENPEEYNYKIDNFLKKCLSK